MALKMDKVNKKNKADEELKKLEKNNTITSSTTEIITALNNPVKDPEPAEEKTAIETPQINTKASAKSDDEKTSFSTVNKKSSKIIEEKKKVGRPKTKNEEYKRIAVDLSPEVYEMALAINSVTDNNMTLCISNLIKDKYMKNEELYKQIMAFKNKLK